MNDIKIAIIGLGYVGLQLAVEFAKKYTVVGFDINISRIDNPLEVEHEYGIKTVNDVSLIRQKFDSVILAVSHELFGTIDWNPFMKTNCVIYDVKQFLPENIIDGKTIKI